LSFPVRGIWPKPKGGTFKIGASLNSRITSVLVTEGQKVARGDTLIQLDDDGAINAHCSIT
jgi:multidrug efflux pump subunit AcrA (membrane-fusion protein)